MVPRVTYGHNIHIYIYSDSAITTYNICVNKKVKKNTPQKSRNIGSLYAIQYVNVIKHFWHYCEVLHCVGRKGCTASFASLGGALQRTV